LSANKPKDEESTVQEKAPRAIKIHCGECQKEIGLDDQNHRNLMHFKSFVLYMTDEGEQRLIKRELSKESEEDQ
jgi:hypothetical protein